MKIEIGEITIASWLKHIKKCQIVQTNWKISPEWKRRNEDTLNELIKCIDTAFRNTNGNIFKKSNTLEKVLKQAECDVIGIKNENNVFEYYAADVAYHIDGLNYGSKKETIRRVICKCARNAICLYGYLNAKKAEVYFISPKINNNILDDLLTEIKRLNVIFNEEFGINYNFRLITNESFINEIYNPLVNKSKIINDDNDLFMRSYQLSSFNNEDK